MAAVSIVDVTPAGNCTMERWCASWFSRSGNQQWWEDSYGSDIR